LYLVIDTSSDEPISDSQIENKTKLYKHIYIYIYIYIIRNEWNVKYRQNSAIKMNHSFEKFYSSLSSYNCNIRIAENNKLYKILNNFNIQFIN
jgi:hypothetical protein